MFVLDIFIFLNGKYNFVLFFGIVGGGGFMH